MPPAPRPSPFAKAGKRIAERLGHAAGGALPFWERVTNGVAMAELWEEFTAGARATYRFYARDVEFSSFEQKPGLKRSLQIGRALFWAMLMKLSPSRRVFLLGALALMVVAVVASNNTVVMIPVAALLFLLALELSDRVTMKRDLEIARDIQRWLVPAAPPQIAGLDIAFATRPANTVSGDYYDAFLRPAAGGGAPHLLLVVADVAGKSVPAALLMATVQASLRTLAEQPAPLAELVRGLNRYTAEHSLGGARFTTAFLAELDPTTLEMIYINAGHNPPVLRRASGGIERLEAGGLPLGIRLDATYEQGRAALGRGDLLVVPTDGVADAENEQEEEYGEARLLDLFRQPPGATADGELKRIMSSVDAFVGPAHQHDDITLLLLLAQNPGQYPHSPVSRPGKGE
jgi:sigma-B regulation protein RsbU (phosphoserine phosphatase)